MFFTLMVRVPTLWGDCWGAASKGLACRAPQGHLPAGCCPLGAVSLSREQTPEQPSPTTPLPSGGGRPASSINSMPTGYGSENHLYPSRRNGSVFTLLNDYIIIIWSPLNVFLYFHMFSFF